MAGPLDNFLERFRRAGGVPASVGGVSEAEYGPLFAALDSIEEEAAELRVRADAEREARRAQLERELAAIAEDAKTRADRARHAAHATARAAAEVEAARITAEGESAAEIIRAHGADRMPGLVADVVARIEGGVR